MDRDHLKLLLDRPKVTLICNRGCNSNINRLWLSKRECFSRNISLSHSSKTRALLKSLWNIAYVSRKILSVLGQGFLEAPTRSTHSFTIVHGMIDSQLPIARTTKSITHSTRNISISRSVWNQNTLLSHRNRRIHKWSIRLSMHLFLHLIRLSFLLKTFKMNKKMLILLSNVGLLKRFENQSRSPVRSRIIFSKLLIGKNIITWWPPRTINRFTEHTRSSSIDPLDLIQMGIICKLKSFLKYYLARRWVNQWRCTMLKHQ